MLVPETQRANDEIGTASQGTHVGVDVGFSLQGGGNHQQSAGVVRQRPSMKGNIHVGYGLEEVLWRKIFPPGLFGDHVLELPDQQLLRVFVTGKNQDPFSNLWREIVGFGTRDNFGKASFHGDGS